MPPYNQHQGREIFSPLFFDAVQETHLPLLSIYLSLLGVPLNSPDFRSLTQQLCASIPHSFQPSFLLPRLLASPTRLSYVPDTLITQPHFAPELLPVPTLMSLPLVETHRTIDTSTMKGNPSSSGLNILYLVIRWLIDVGPFFNSSDWNFYNGDDPTHGLVNYQSLEKAKAKNLAYVKDGVTVLTVDSTSTVPVGGKRDS